MRQYLDVKRQHRDAIVFFRMGDFYEMFYEDALTAARVLELTLTSRAKDARGAAIPMCGVPYHAADTYLARLVRKGYRVAICDQVEDPRKAKGIVKREVTRVVSPGTFTDAGVSRGARAGVSRGGRAAPASRRRRWGLAFLDVSTGEFAAAEFAGAGRGGGAGRRTGACCVRRSSWWPTAIDLDGAAAARWRRRASRASRRGRSSRRARARRSASNSSTASLAGYGLDDAPAAVVGRRRDRRVPARDAARASSRTSATSRCASPADALLIDPVTLRHLNVVEGADGGRAGSLLDEIDRTVDADGRPAAARSGCCGRSSRSRGFRIGSTPSKTSRSARPSAASCASCSRACTTSSG